MKKYILGLVLSLALAAPTVAAVNVENIRIGVQGYIGATPIDNIRSIVSTTGLPAVFVIDIAKEYEINVGFGSFGLATKGADAHNRFYLEGKWYMMKADGILIGPSINFINMSVNAAATKSSDNNASVISLGCSAKKKVLDNLSLKMDLYVLQLISGKLAATDIKDSTQVMPSICTSLILYLF